MGCTVFRVMQGPGKYPLQHAGNLWKRDNALRSTGLQNGLGPGLDMRLSEQGVRRISGLRREACSGVRRTNGKAIHNHDAKSLLSGVRQIGFQHNDALGLFQTTPCVAVYQCGHFVS
jgi:hypothetical protein